MVYDSAERVGTITLPDGASQLVSPYQEQGWTNSGTSGSPAPATLLAAPNTTYTDPNGNSFRDPAPTGTGLGQLNQAIDPYGDVATNDLQRQRPAQRHRRPRSTGSRSTPTTARGMPTTITYPDLSQSTSTPTTPIPSR